MYVHKHSTGRVTLIARPAAVRRDFLLQQPQPQPQPQSTYCLHTYNLQLNGPNHRTRDVDDVVCVCLQLLSIIVDYSQKRKEQKPNPPAFLSTIGLFSFLVQPEKTQGRERGKLGSGQ
jgi:hypothetical protein